jgi:hypothetical protein
MGAAVVCATLPEKNQKGNTGLNKNLIFAVCLGLGSLSSGNAQEPQASKAEQTTAVANHTNDADIRLLREDIRSERKKIVAENLPLTSTEATKFWPIYDQYVGEMKKVNDGRYSIIKQYAESYQTMTDRQAQDLITRWLSADTDDTRVRMKYVPQFEKAIPAKKVAAFFQIDHRIDLILNLQVASQLPLAIPQDISAQ